MPAISVYQPGYTTTVETESNVRTGPSTSAKVIRKTAAPEAWVIVGQVAGETVNGEKSWTVRWNSGWEYTHADNTSVPMPPPSAAELAKLDKAINDALVSSGRTTTILREAKQ